MIKRTLTLLASGRFRLILMAGIVLLALVFALKHPLAFGKFAPGRAVAMGWKAGMRDAGDGADRYHYALAREGTPAIELTRLSFDDLEFTVLNRGDRTFLLTRYLGSGSSGAYYYSLYQMAPDSLVPVAASEARDWGEDGACADAPKVSAPPADPSTVFGDCTGPTVSEGALTFRMPGWHCSLFQSGGCASEVTVPLN